VVNETSGRQMHISRLKLNNFRNIKEADLLFCQNINCFVGANGVGKTNILDAIYYLSFCKSYFNILDANNISYGESFFAINGFYEMALDSKEHFSASMKKGEKKLFRFSDKEYTKLSEHIGKVPLVMITPLDERLIIGGSESRRRFVDSVISQADSIYLHNVIAYNKALEQKNSLLRKYSFGTMPTNCDSLDIWDEQLLRYGLLIYEKRKEFLLDFSPLFEFYYNYISSKKEKVSLSYKTNVYQQTFASMILSSRQRDLILTYSTIGVHKDDLNMSMEGYEIKKQASQGQQKSFLLALKLAQFEYLYKQRGIKPILLLDDVFDKLDAQRVSQLINLVGTERFGQVFITDTQQGRVEEIFENTQIEHKLFAVSEGGINEQ
jgi:recF protein